MFSLLLYVSYFDTMEVSVSLEVSLDIYPSVKWVNVNVAD